jgi:pimeloyl-ACP methyl ester carboxylesterase
MSNVEKYRWSWQNSTYEVAYENLGQGSPILLLPAFSTVSTRTEMRGIAQTLAMQYQVILLDWLGFGESDRPALDYKPAIYLQLLRDFAQSHFGQPIPVIGAGHAASYIMQIANESPQVWSKIVLIAPTWRGPLPTAMGEYRPQYGILRTLVRSPILGQFLYNLTTTPSFLSMMYRRHVYILPDRVTPDLIRQKRQTTQQPGARFASAAFVTGNLDMVLSREDFLKLFQKTSVPIAIAIGQQTPPKSQAEMEAITETSNISVFRMPGSLGMHEECSDALAKAIQPFLGSS